jgi:hypothetical protein
MIMIRFAVINAKVKRICYIWPSHLCVLNVRPLTGDPNRASVFTTSRDSAGDVRKYKTQLPGPGAKYLDVCVCAWMPGLSCACVVCKLLGGLCVRHIV